MVIEIRYSVLLNDEILYDGKNEMVAYWAALESKACLIREVWKDWSLMSVRRIDYSD